MSTNEPAHSPMNKKLKMVLVGVALFFGIGIVVASVTATEDVPKPAASQSHSSKSTKEPSAKSSKPYKKTKDKGMNDEFTEEANYLKKNIELVRPGCDWKKSDNGGIVDVYTCEKHELLIAVGNQSGVKVWINSMRDDTENDMNGRGGTLHAKNWAAISPDKETINTLWDVTGAAATNEKL